MIGKLLRQTYVLIFMLTVLFTTCVLTDVRAHTTHDEDWSSGYAGLPFTAVYGYAWSYIVWDHHANSVDTYHHVFTQNDGNEAIKHYWDFWADVAGPTNTPAKSDAGDEVVPPGETKYADKSFSFGMTGKERGRYDAYATTNLRVKLFRHGAAVGTHPWQASCTLAFNWGGWGR